MKNNNLVEFNSLVIQRQQQNELAREQYEEEAHMILISKLNKSDIIQNEKAKVLSRKLMSRVNNFYKSIEENEKDTKFLMINNDTTLEDFKEYLLSKTKLTEREEYETAFRDQKFVNDIKNLLRLKSYEHKQDRELQGNVSFFSARAKCASSIAMVIKSNRTKLHESMARAGKVYLTMADGTQQALTNEQLQQIMPAMTAPIEKLMMEQMGDILSIEFMQLPMLEQ